MTSKQETRLSKRKISQNDHYFSARRFFRENKLQFGSFWKILRFESRVSCLEVMQGTQKLGGRLLGSMHTFWAPFPWRSTFFKNIPQIRQNANKLGIFGHLGEHMFKRGTAREKN